MRNDWRVRAVALLGSVLAAAGCTTTQPEILGERTASVRIVATAEFVRSFNCYEIWANDPISGILTFTGNIECYQAADTATRRAIPWHYAVTISVIRKGTTTEEIVTSRSGVFGSSIEPGDGIDNFISMTGYDPTDQPADFRPPEVRSGGVVLFLNGRKVSPGNAFWQEINGFAVTDPNILTEFPTFDFDVNSGDTVIVRARKQTVALSQDFLPRVPDPNIKLSGTLSIGGALVTPSGITISSIGDATGISFSFTVQ